mmetsp:Transcript_54928/g.119810  ORF Transcript_54928/g.119810 Transcript_54928/m.119810 type:complete len:189 (-) Transcript_54928:685-1251(-)
MSVARGASSSTLAPETPSKSCTLRRSLRSAPRVFRRLTCMHARARSCFKPALAASFLTAKPGKSSTCPACTDCVALYALRSASLTYPLGRRREVSVRPHVPVLLNYLRRSGAWHVIVWTAAEKSYADAVLDGLEGNARVLTRRLYQQHCAIGPTGFIKARAFAERSHSFPWSRVVLARAQHTSFFFSR